LSDHGSESHIVHVARGLEGVVAAATHIAEVDGERGRLTLRGYDIGELAGRITFEEVAYLLLYGKLPNQTEYDGLLAEMRQARELPEATLKALRELAPHAEGMDILRMGAAMLSVGDPTLNDLDVAGSRRRAIRLLAQMPALVAHSWRLKNGLDIVHPKPEHGVAASFLYMLEGVEPHEGRVHGLDSYLVAISEHGLNASTFAGRVVISTDSDMVSALTAAVGALKGPKHGGVPGPVLRMLEEIGTPDRAEPWIRNALANGKRIMGFGHRIYRVRDPRAALLSKAADRMAELTGDSHLLELTKAVEETTVRVLAEVKPGRDLYANVELYAALILHAVNIPEALFTPCFGIGRTAGWTAHMVEQLEDNRLIRPNSIYAGPRGLRWKPIESRA
jgi:citrate synthase